MCKIFVAIAIILGLLIPRASPAAAPDAATVAVEKRLDRIETQLTSAVSLLSAIKVLADQAGPRLDKQDTQIRDLQLMCQQLQIRQSLLASDVDGLKAVVFAPAEASLLTLKESALIGFILLAIPSVWMLRRKKV
jgi:hypothetical protein